MLKYIYVFYYIILNVTCKPLVDDTSKSSPEVDLHNFLVPKKEKKAKLKCNAVRSVSDNSPIAYRTCSKVSKNNECVVIDIIKPSENTTRKASRSLTCTADFVGRKSSTVKKGRKTMNP